MRARIAAAAIALALPLVTSGCSPEAGTPVRVSDSPGGSQAVSVTATEGSVPATPLPTSSSAFEPGEPEKLGPVPPRVVKHGPRSRKRVALTFDLCSTEEEPGGYDGRIVRILRDEGVAATFFMGGIWAREHREQAADLGRDDDFEIGNHSDSHPDMSGASREENERQVDAPQREIARRAGVTPRLFRFPGGLYDDQALDVVARRGLVAVEWDVNPGDPDPNISADRLAEWVPENVKPGSIVLMHANGRGVHTAEALPRIIKALRKRGYEFVTVSEMLED